MRNSVNITLAQIDLFVGDVAGNTRKIVDEKVDYCRRQGNSR